MAPDVMQNINDNLTSLLTTHHSSKSIEREVHLIACIFILFLSSKREKPPLQNEQFTCLLTYQLGLSLQSLRVIIPKK